MKQSLRASRAAAVIAIATVLGSVGCDVYDEPARSPAESAGGADWTALSDGQRTISPGRPAGIEYVEGYTAAAARAAADRRPMLVLFRAAWCRWCGEMTAKVLAEQQVVQRSRRFVCVTVDADREREICRRHDIRGFPTILLLTPDRDEIARRTGRVSSAELVALLEQAGNPPASLATPAVRKVR